MCVENDFCFKNASCEIKYHGTSMPHTNPQRVRLSTHPCFSRGIHVKENSRSLWCPKPWTPLMHRKSLRHDFVAFRLDFSLTLSPWRDGGIKNAPFSVHAVSRHVHPTQKNPTVQAQRPPLLQLGKIYVERESGSQERKS